MAREPIYSGNTNNNGSVNKLKILNLKSTSCSASFELTPKYFSPAQLGTNKYRFNFTVKLYKVSNSSLVNDFYVNYFYTPYNPPLIVKIKELLLTGDTTTVYNVLNQNNTVPLVGNVDEISILSTNDPMPALISNTKYRLEIQLTTVLQNSSSQVINSYDSDTVKITFTTPKSTKVSVQKPQAKSVVIPHGAHMDGLKAPQKTVTQTKKTVPKSSSTSKSSTVGTKKKTTTTTVQSVAAPKPQEQVEIAKTESQSAPKKPIIPILKTTIPDIQNSVLSITNNSKNSDKVSIAIKNMNFPTTYSALNLATYIYEQIPYKYFAFGTTMFLDFNEKKPEQAGGLGFFTNDTGTDGYFIFTRSTARYSTGDKRDIYVAKVVGGSKTILKDTQNSSDKRVTAIYGGETYNITALVNNSTSAERKITIYVNGKKFVATDPEPEDLPVTTYVGLMAQTGTANYDYVYAYPLTEEEFNNPKKILNKNGKIEDQAMSFLFGNRVFDSTSEEHIGTMLEFGTTAKEIKQIKTKYESGNPGYAKYASKGINPHIEILGTKTNNFGFEMFLMNNTGGQVPASDGNSLSFQIVGTQVYNAGQLEYKTDTPSDAAGLEPIIFDSTWIQKEEDAKKLADWIKTQWSKKQIIVRMSVFGNPLISPGDIVKINYSRPGLTDSMRFLVTDVTLNYNQGLETDIVCRAIYS